MAVETKSASFCAVSRLDAQTGYRSRLPNLKNRLYQGLRRLLFEIIPLFLIAGFFWLQVQIGNQTTGLVSGILTMLIFLIELGLLTILSLLLPELGLHRVDLRD